MVSVTSRTTRLWLSGLTTGGIILAFLGEIEGLLHSRSNYGLAKCRACAAYAHDWKRSSRRAHNKESCFPCASGSRLTTLAEHVSDYGVDFDPFSVSRSLPEQVPDFDLDYEHLYESHGDNATKNDIRTENEPDDSIEKYANDIATVLKKLRSSAYDPAIPAVWRGNNKLPSFTNTWTLDDWDRHKSRYRYVDYLLSIPTSRLIRRIAPQLCILTLWSILASRMCARGVLFFQRAVLPLTPLSLVSSFVAVLLTLRSNQGLSRLNEGRLALGKVVLYTRDMAQLIASNVYPKDKALGLKAARHVALFSWLLKGFLRGDKVNGSDDDIIRTMLPAASSTSSNAVSADAAYVMQQRKKPVAVVTRLRQIFAHLQQQGQLTTSEASRLDHTVQQLNHCVMVTERIQATPIPPKFSAHLGRLLMFYLFFLPLALRGSGLLNGLGTVITTFAVGYAMFGLDEISHLVEEPFRNLPLWHLSKNSMKDCGDALVCRPPPLNPDEPWSLPAPPPYW